MQQLIQAGNRVLEIGVGSGFTANYLRSKGVIVTTLDIDEDKSPDIVANVVTYDFPEQYDCVLAFEIFEHIPFQEFQSVLLNLGTSCSRYLFFSVPRNRKTVLALNVKLPKLKPISFDWKIRRGKLLEPHHFWELDHDGKSITSLERTLHDAGFCVRRCQEAFNRCFFACENTSTHSS